MTENLRSIFAVGVNCTSPQFAEAIVQSLRSSLPSKNIVSLVSRENKRNREKELQREGEERGGKREGEEREGGEREEGGDRAIKKKEKKKTCQAKGVHFSLMFHIVFLLLRCALPFFVSRALPLTQGDRCATQTLERSGRLLRRVKKAADDGK